MRKQGILSLQRQSVNSIKLTTKSSMFQRSTGSSSKIISRPPHHGNDAGTTFINPWPSAEAPTWAELLQNNFPLGLYDNLAKKHPGTKDVKVVIPDWGVSALRKRGLEKEKCIIATTLGHASAITEMQLEGARIDGGKESFWVVYDPIFSARAGPTQYTGPQRMRAPPCQVMDLPGCDAIVISHNHYDHLDLFTIKSILKRFPKAKYLVPLGNKSWICSLGVPEDRVFALDWWEHHEFSLEDIGRTQSKGSENTILKFTCVPAQHNSGRGAMDQGTTLWCGWVIEQLLVSKDEDRISKYRRKGSIYHAGDTGYRRTAKSTAICPIFQEIGRRFGGFDLSFVPIWRGGSLGFLSALGIRLSHNDIPSTFHASPADAIEIHRDVLSRNTVAVHFGTFVGSVDESLEAIMEFEEARENREVLRLNEAGHNRKGRAGIIDIGGSAVAEIGVEDRC